jgi:hypothetical protein
VIFGRLQSYIIYRITSSLLILGFFFFAIILLGLEMPTWAIIIINITNDASVMATSFDKVRSASPLRSLQPIFFRLHEFQALLSVINSGPVNRLVQSLTLLVNLIFKACSSDE